MSIQQHIDLMCCTGHRKSKKKKKFIVHRKTNNTNSDVTTSTKVLCRAARIAKTITAGRPTYMKFTQAVNNSHKVFINISCNAVMKIVLSWWAISDEVCHYVSLSENNSDTIITKNRMTLMILHGLECFVLINVNVNKYLLKTWSSCRGWARTLQVHVW